MNKYFAVLGRSPELSLFERSVLGVERKRVSNFLITFSVPEEKQGLFERCKQHIGGTVKRGQCVGVEGLEEALDQETLIGVSDQTLGMLCKKRYGIKRFKLIDKHATDLTIKEQGTEIVSIDEKTYGIVTHYQNIPLFELIDFEKPVRGMQVGMMPAKLTQLLMNIAIAAAGNDEKAITVFDPFCGFGTTGFVGNAYGYNVICSDINPTPTKQNLPWWEEQKFATKQHFTVFKHDATESFEQPFLRFVDCIVTEGRLGPVIGMKAAQQLNRQQLNERREEIEKVYCDFIRTLNAPTQQENGLAQVPIVITYPQWTFTQENMSERFVTVAQGLGYKVEEPEQLYSRKGQQVARRILLLRK